MHRLKKLIDTTSAKDPIRVEQRAGLGLGRHGLVGGEERVIIMVPDN